MFRFVCIKSVFVLTTECSSLTVTLVVTLRKFVSLLFSIFYFNNPFTAQHWFATFLVFGGTFIFVELGPKLQQALTVKPSPAHNGADTTAISPKHKTKEH